MLDAVESPLHQEASRSSAEPRSGRCAVTGHMVSLRPLSDSASLVPAWGALSQRALVPNIYYDPAFAIPAADPFGDGVMLAAVHGANGELLAAWPVRVSRRRWGVPLPVLMGWTHPFAASGVPLLDRDHASDALLALLNLPATIGRLPRRAILPLIPEAGPFAELLDAQLTRLRLRQSHTERHDRPELNRGTDPLAHFSSGTRSKLRQEERRLEKLGHLHLEQISDPAAIGEALEDYLALEGSGWKARAGTAIPQSAAETRFMTASVHALAAQGRVRIDRLRIDGTTIASSITYFTGDTAWYAKISYNEDHARNSPGSHLVLRATESLLADPAIQRTDSCAPPLHPLMRKFWPRRFWLSNRTIELCGGDPLFPIASRLERLRPAIRDRINRWRKRGGDAHKATKASQPSSAA